MKYPTKIITDLIENAVKGHKVIEGDELYICNKKVFGDDEEHELNFYFLDGIAISEDKAYFLTYPKKRELTRAMKAEIRDYDGIPAPRSYTSRDIALCYGVISKNSE